MTEKNHQKSLLTNSLYKQLVESALEAIVVVNPVGEIVLTNARLCELFGYSESELLGKKIEMLVPTDLRDKHKHQRDAYFKHSKPRSMGEGLELFGQHKDGTRFPIEVSLNPFENSGESLVVGLITDISKRVQAQEELRTSEERYRVLLHSASEGIVIVNDRGDIEVLNKRVGDLFQYSEDELVGQPIEILVPQASRSAHKKLRQNYMSQPAHRSMGRDLTLNGVRKDGSVFPIEVSLSPVKIRETTLIMAFIVDVTEKRRAEQMAELHRQQLIQADKMATLGTLVSGVAHEINNPNNYILLNANILQEVWKGLLPILEKHAQSDADFRLAGMPYSRAEQKIGRLIDATAEGSVRIQRIVESLKNFAKQDPGLLEEDVDMNDVVESAITITHNLIKRSSNKFTVSLSESLPTIRGNFQRLEQVVINLLANSCDALDDRSKALTVTTSEEENRVVLRIADEGNGIPDDVIEQVFDPFFTTKRTSGGTGLGLSICYNILAAHSGLLEIESTSPAGTTFKISLPVVAARVME
ncbi:MAG: PAS domain-containing sensor histidine kinase [Calditrichia bacterium]